MKEYEKKLISRICLLGNAAFTALSAINSYFAIPAAALSVAPYFWEIPFSHKIDYHEHLVRELNEVINEAIIKTKDIVEERKYNEQLDEQQLKVIKEILEPSLEISDVNAWIYNAEKCSQDYSNMPYVNEIVDIFNVFFIEEISKNNVLCQICLLNTGKSTLTELKKIQRIVQDTNQKVTSINDGIDDMNQEVSNISREVSGMNQEISKFSIVLKKFNIFITNVIDSSVFSMVSMSVFVLLSIFAGGKLGGNVNYQKNALFWIVPLSYFIPDIILNIYGFKLHFKNRYSPLMQWILKFVSSFLIRILSSVTFFSILSQFLGIVDISIFGLLVLFFVAGNIIGQILVNIMSKASH